MDVFAEIRAIGGPAVDDETADCRFVLQQIMGLREGLTHLRRRVVGPGDEGASTTLAGLVPETSPLADLRERLVKADGSLRRNAMTTDDQQEAARMRGKAEGVRLALSYLDEYLREG